jgi:hypothetical protein
MAARFLYALAALAVTAYGAYFVWWKADAVFTAAEIPLPFERFGAVAAAGAALFLVGFFTTVYKLLFETFHPRNPS